MGRTARAKSAPWLYLTKSNKDKGPHKEVHPFVHGTETRMPGREAINNQALEFLGVPKPLQPVSDLQKSLILQVIYINS